MRTTLLAALALTAIVATPSLAWADEISDRADAVSLCRTQVSTQSGIAADAIRLDEVRTRPNAISVHFNIWQNGARQDVRCNVSRSHGQLTVASIDPALTTPAVASGH